MPLLLGKMDVIPPASLAFAAALSTSGSRLPQTIAHRGYKAAFPENSMGAFHGAVTIGAHAIETDLHLSKDGVVVLTHDASLKRCFGIDKKVADCNWSYLSTLRTLREPQQGLPRLSDLLEYLGQPGLEPIWLLLDIKIDDDGDDLLGRTAETIRSVLTARPWKERIVLGAWNENYINLCREHLPGFPIAYIGFSVIYARKFLGQPGVHFNLLQKTLVGPVGRRFIKAAGKAGQSVFVWTVNDEQWMEWSIRSEVDGVITDDPKRFLEVCNRFGGTAGTIPRTRRIRAARLYVGALLMQVVYLVGMVLLWHRFSTVGRTRRVKEGLVAVKA